MRKISWVKVGLVGSIVLFSLVLGGKGLSSKDLSSKDDLSNRNLEVRDYGCEASKYEEGRKRREEFGVSDKIYYLKSRVNVELIRKIEMGLKYCERENLTLSVIKAESEFRLGAVNEGSKDYGLMQINDWHVRRNGYSRKKLLEDAEYNIRIGCGILDELVRKHGEDEGVKRYNCGYRKGCVKWRSVRAYGDKVLGWRKSLDKREDEVRGE